MSDKRIHVLHTVSRMHPGGLERWLLNVMGRMDRNKFLFTICTAGEPGGDYEAQTEALGGRFVRCRWKRSLWKYGRAFRRILRADRYDILHAHLHNLAGFQVRVAAAEGIPHRIVHLRSTTDGRPATLPRRAYRALAVHWTRRNATRVLGCARGALESFLGPDWVHDDRMSVLYSGIHCGSFGVPGDREGVRREFGIPPNVPLIIHVGRLTAAKNHRSLIDIVRAIQTQRPEIHCLLVGEGELRPQVEAHIAALGLQGSIHLAGQRTDIVRLLSAADVFVMPSSWEGLPGSLVEAAAAGLRAVASDLPGMREANEYATQTVLVPTDAPAQRWADVILEVLSKPAPDARASLERVKRSILNSDNSATALAEIYQSCMTTGRAVRT